MIWHDYGHGSSATELAVESLYCRIDDLANGFRVKITKRGECGAIYVHNPLAQSGLFEKLADAKAAAEVALNQVGTGWIHR